MADLGAGKMREVLPPAHSTKEEEEEMKIQENQKQQEEEEDEEEKSGMDNHGIKSTQAQVVVVET